MQVQSERCMHLSSYFTFLQSVCEKGKIISTAHLDYLKGLCLKQQNLLTISPCLTALKLLPYITIFFHPMQPYHQVKMNSRPAQLLPSFLRIEKIQFGRIICFMNLKHLFLGSRLPRPQNQPQAMFKVLEGTVNRSRNIINPRIPQLVHQQRDTVSKDSLHLMKHKLLTF